MHLRKYAAVAALALGTTAANAATYDLTIQKRMFSAAAWNITSVRVKGAEVSGLPKNLEPRDFTVQVTMPDGQCVSNVTVFFIQAFRADMHDVDICKEPTLVLDLGRR